MKSLTHYRLAAVRVAIAVLILFAGISAFVSAASLPTVGHTGQALALHSALHRGLPGAFFENSRVPLPATGRHLSDLDAMQKLVGRPMRGLRPMASGNPLVTINEAVQTFDVFAPRNNNFVPTDGALTPTNQTPVWSSDESFIVFASNRAGDGHTHLFAVSSGGDLTGGVSSIRQITKGTADEAFPALNPANNSLAFTSTAGNGTPNLYVIPFNFQALPVGNTGAINPTALASLTIRADLTTGFGAVGRPTFAPGGDRIVFAAQDVGGATPGVSHLWFLFFGSNGGRVGSGPTNDNPPVKLTSGLAFDADPAYSPDGSYIAFDSTATSIQTNPAGTATGVGTAPTLTTGSQSVRNLFLISGGTTLSQSVFGSVPPTTGSFDGHITAGSGVDDFGPAWSAATQNAYLNPNNVFEYLAWARGRSVAGPHDIYFLRTTELIANNTDTITAEGQNTAEGFANGAVRLNTDDNAGETSAGGNVFNDVYPTWSPFSSVFSIAYGSNRSITYNAPATNVPQEQAVSLAPNTNGVGAGYMGILQSQVLNLDPPLLIPFGGGDVVRVTDSANRVTRNIQPGQATTFTVRLSNREAGTDPNNVYVQLKDPNSKYQDAQGLEHKVFTKDFPYYDLHPTETYGGINSSVAASIFNGGQAFNPTLDPRAIILPTFNAGFNKIGNATFPQRGAIGGQDGGDTVSVGTYTFDLTATPPEVTPNKAAPVDDTRFLPFGQEYEAQFVNPTVANPGTAVGDFGTPFYLAGVDDNGSFSGSDHPARPTTEWIPLHPLVTDANGNPLPDAAGGVLYTATYTTPTAFGSDFYLDTIAYDKATFPAVPVDTSNFSRTSVVTIDPVTGQPVTTIVPALSTNWRIYDNTGGFTTASFGSSSAVDTLVVADNTLGQKFAASTFRGRGGAENLPPEFYGAESYFTDIDKNLLPNSVYFQVAPATSPTPPNPGAPQLQSMPTNLSATPGNNLVTLVWTGIVNGQTPPQSYNIYRSMIPGTEGPGLSPPLANIPGNSITTYVDRTATNGQIFYYVVTAVVSAGNETGPSNEASATPFAPGTTPVPSVQLLTNLVQTGFSANGLATNGPVLNGLGVGSYNDGAIDDGRTVDGVAAVRSQQYSIWRVLSRGPVPVSVLQSYAPTFIRQPAVADSQTGFTAAAADGSDATHPLVPVANRCVIWSSPYTGNLLTSSGSILDTDTQTNLKNFVNSGGRLFVSGATVASAITQNGAVNQAATDFLPSVLDATLGAPAGGSQVLAGASAPGNRIGFDAFYNESTNLGFAQNFPMLNGNLTITYQAPSQSPVFELGNNYLDGPVATTLRARTDGSLDQLGPFAQGIGAALVNGQIDTINAQNGAHTDITFTGAGLPGLVYNENVATGGRSIFSSFGLEGMGIEYYKVSNNNINFFPPRNLRPNILHNVVTYLRTGTFTGTITQRTGVGVPGATVYLLSNGGAVIPGSAANRQTFSAVTDSSGQYIIQGVESGAYVVVAYKSGFTRATSQSIGIAFGVEGGSQARVNLNINPVPPGSLSGVVKDTSGRAVAGATVTFTAADGSGTTITATTDVNGNYAIPNSVSPNSYNGSAQKGTQFGPNPPTQGNPVVVASGATTIANFVLTTAPATLSGVVTDATTGAGLVGATVTLTPTAGGVAVTATTLAAATTPATPAGFYTVTLPSGSYTATASKLGYTTSGALPLTLQPGQRLTQNFALTVAPLPAPGTLGGLVADSFTGKAAGGATVTLMTSATPPAAVTDINGNPVLPVTTTTTTTSPGAPTGDGAPQNYAFTNLPAGTYTVTVKAHGTTLTLPNQVVTAGAFTRSDFTAANGNALPPLHVFPAGYNFFSVPYDYSSQGVSGIDAIFGTLNTGTRAAPSAGSNRSHLFVWSPTLLQYLLDPTPPADGLHVGQGYWVYLLNASEVTTPGILPTQTTVSVGLHLGWNQIGVPSLGAIPVSGLTFGDGTVTFAQATDVTHHLIYPTLYGYDGNAYVPITAGGSLQTWQSYWIYAFADTTVQIPSAATPGT